MERGKAVGRWMQQRRLTLDLTQEQLSEQVGCEKDTISFIETGRRRPSKQLAAQLAKYLQIDTEAQSDFVSFARRFPATRFEPEIAPLLGADAAPGRSVDRWAGLTVTISREHEIAQVCTLLRSQTRRLVTLTGPGGIGKTKIALEVARVLGASYDDNVYVVPLASVSDHRRVLSMIAHVLEIKNLGRRPLLEHMQVVLRPQRLLLVLDTVEHVRAAATQLVDLLAAAPDLAILVTSRVRLGIRGEQVVVVPPLAVPDESQCAQMTAADLRGYSAAELFIQRASEASHEFLVIDENAPAIAHICARLDGLPLAIELSAARVGMFSPQTIWARIQQRLPVFDEGGLDAPPHHRTLIAAFDWSYDLLPSPEQQLFVQLAVFVGGCTLEAVTAVCASADADAATMFYVLDMLVKHNLLYVREDIDGEVRFLMLRPIRDYALGRFERSDSAQEVRRRHACYYALHVISGEAALTGPAQQARLSQLEQEHENLSAALIWLLDNGSADTALQMSAALWPFWLMHGHLHEGRTYLAATLDRAGTADRAIQAKATIGAANIAVSQADYAAARLYLQQSLALYQALDDKHGLASSLSTLGHVALNMGDLDQARRLTEQSLLLQQDLGDTRRIGTALNNVADVALAQGDLPCALELAEQSVHLLRQLGNDYSLSIALVTGGFAALRLGQHRLAHTMLHESLQLKQGLADKEGIAWCLEGLAAIAGASGHGRRVACLLGAAEMLRETIDIPLRAADQAARDALRSIIRDRLGVAVWLADWTAGRAMPLEQAVAYALQDAQTDQYRERGR